MAASAAGHRLGAAAGAAVAGHAPAPPPAPDPDHHAVAAIDQPRQVPTSDGRMLLADDEPGNSLA